MNKTIDLTQGPIFKQLVKLAMPIIGTSFMQMAYNLTDMIWIGRVGSDAVASVGAAGFFFWFGISLLLITRIGAEVGVSQSYGRKDGDMAARFARHALFWGMVLSLLYATATFVFSPQLIGIFRLSSPKIEGDAIDYLRIISCGFVFTFVNPTFQGIYNGAGNSRRPFWYLFIGLVLNIVLDPLLILGVGPFPRMEVEGAAVATVISQLIVFGVFIFRFIIKSEMMSLDLRKFHLSRDITRQVFKVGSPVALESCLFAIFAMVLARMITKWGDTPIAVQSVGSQIEAISWMTSSGFATALGSFTGQNFGAGNWARIRKGYFTTLGIGAMLGTIVTVAFMAGGKYIFSVFLYEPEPLRLGIIYLKILGISQVFMITEIITRGAFNGIGRSVPPSVVGIVFTGMRIPAAMVLTSEHIWGMYGIWWALTFSSVLKGVVLMSWFMIVLSHAMPDNIPMRKRILLAFVPTRIRQQIFSSEEEIE
ncbi:MATE family efflux transporter [Marinilabiliaceae bacterium JC017]|nr:MATE family efflux transporter [Marinilabiliaceae bacterium JC017]